MKFIKSFIFLLFITHFMYSQDQKTYLGISIFSYYSNPKFISENTAIGPSLKMSSNKFNVNVIIYYSFKKYSYYEKVGLNQYEKKFNHLYLLASIDYSILKKKNINISASSGLITDNRINIVGDGSIGTNLCIGVYVVFEMNKFLFISISPIYLIKSNDLIPGIHSELNLPIN